MPGMQHGIWRLVRCAESRRRAGFDRNYLLERLTAAQTESAQSGPQPHQLLQDSCSMLIGAGLGGGD